MSGSSVPPSPAAPETPADPVTQFEAALAELESIVERMEQSDFPLEESIRLFERGVALARQCRQSLSSAELRVKRLLEAETEERNPRTEGGGTPV